MEAAKSSSYYTELLNSNLMLKRSTHFTVGMLNAKTGSHTGSYSGLYVPEPKERHVLSERASE